MFDQASKISAKFGGPGKLAAVLGINPSNVYRWTYPRSRGGTDGMIPSINIGPIRRVARREGILLTAHNWNPEPIVATLPAELE